MRTRESVCRRKVRYASRGEAMEAATTSGLILHAYACDRCFRFHLTSRTKGRRRQPASAEPGRVQPSPSLSA